MSESSGANYNLDRTHRVLKARTHLLAFYYFFMGAGSIWLIMGLLALGVFGTKDDSFGVTSSLIVGLALPVIMMFAARVLIYPAANTRVEITSDRLIIRRFDREIVIPFSDVIQVELSHWPFVAGWMRIIIKDQPSQYLNVAIERSEYILDALLSHNSQLAKTELAQNYRRTAIYYDHSWARLYDRFNSRRKFIVKYLLTALLWTVTFFALRSTVHGESSPTVYQVLLFYVGTVLFLIVLGLVLWLISESVILAPISRQRLRVDASKPVRPVDLERRVEYGVNICYLIVAAIVLSLLI